MTRTEYMAMANNALQHYERLVCSLPRNTHIVFVLSREVYLAMLREEYQFDVRQTGTQALYYGVPICCINEDNASEFFMPVVHSRNFHHYDGVQVNDFVLFNDEDNDYLYKLVRLTPDAMYVDTGLTVTFLETPPQATVWAEAVEGVLAEAAIAADATAANTIAYNPGADAITYAGIPGEDYAGTANVAAVDGVLEQLTDWRREYIAQWVTEPVQTERPVVGKRKTVVKEKELNPGDTELIDEYLNSFLRSGV